VTITHADELPVQNHLLIESSYLRFDKVASRIEPIIVSELYMTNNKTSSSSTILRRGSCVRRVRASNICKH
jgi:hypothetical protein